MKKHELTAFILDKRGRLLSTGVNSYVKTHTLQARLAKEIGEPDRIYLHAELHAIVRCRNLSKAHRIVVTRYGKDGRPLLAKPCSICMKAIEDTPIKVIEYTTNHLISPRNCIEDWIVTHYASKCRDE